MQRVDFDMYTSDVHPVLYGVTFVRVNDEDAVTGDFSHVWHVTARGGRREHASLCAISGPLRIELSRRGQLSESRVISGLAKIYRRNLAEIVATTGDVRVTATHEQRPLFEGVPNEDALARVVEEAEALAFVLGQLPDFLRAAKSGTANALPLPPTHEWIAAEPLLRLQESHGAFREFFDNYRSLPRAWQTSDTEEVAAKVRRCSALAALALHQARLAKVDNLSIHRGA